MLAAKYWHLFGRKEENSLSRIGNMPITVPAGVTVTIGANNEVTVKGPKGELKQSLPEDIILRTKRRYD